MTLTFPALLALDASLVPSPCKTISVRVVVLGQNKTHAAMAPSDAMHRVERASAMCEQYGLSIRWTSVVLEVSRAYFDLPRWHWWSVASSRFRWFSKLAQDGIVTAFVVNTMAGQEGWACPYKNWFVVTGRALSSTWLHELMHLAGQWTHDSDLQNFMAAKSGWRVRPDQVAKLGRSRFAKEV